MSLSSTGLLHTIYGPEDLRGLSADELRKRRADRFYAIGRSGLQ